MAEAPESGIVEIDGSLCQGHGRCYSLAPELFEWDPDTDHGRVLDAVVLGERLDLARRIARECPERAITVRVPSGP